MSDNWQHRSANMTCSTCMWFVGKKSQDPNASMILGRCRRRAPTMSGYPVVFTEDFCGDHKIDEEKV